jgi:hypothetical protein
MLFSDVSAINTANLDICSAVIFCFLNKITIFAQLLSFCVEKHHLHKSINNNI